MKFEQIFAISRENAEEIINRVSEKCKNDKGFEQELLNHTTETLNKEGLELQPGIRFQLVKTKEEASQLPDNVIPLSFENKKDALSPDDLDRVVGGTSSASSEGSVGGMLNEFVGIIFKDLKDRGAI